ncbi:MAG: hypothetical protein AB7P69_09765 [Candidatus Binatia bacterium]
MRAKLFIALCWVWSTVIAGLGVNLVSPSIDILQHLPWITTGFGVITRLTLWTWKDYRFAEATKHFPPFKEARELRPGDLDFQEWKPGETIDPGNRPYNKTYIARRAIPLDADPDIEPGYEEPALRRFLREGKGFVFIGQPGAGKTRTLFSLLHLMTGYTVVRPKVGPTPPESAFTIFKDRRVVVFLNDLDEYESFDLQEFYKKIKAQAVSCAVVATCRDGATLRKVTIAKMSCAP